MSSIPRFAEYAAAFEKAYAADDWQLLEPFFTENAVYDPGLPEFFGGPLRGRDAVLAGLAASVAAFDRRFTSRALVPLEGPRERDGSVWVRGRADYTSPLAPDLSFVLEETAHFDGDRIARLEDAYEPEVVERLLEYAARYGQVLGFPAGPRR